MKAENRLLIPGKLSVGCGRELKLNMFRGSVKKLKMFRR